MHFKKQEKTEAERKKSTERRGFYLALAVCLTAIGIAAWSTYDTVSGFLEPTGSESSASSAASTPRPTPETSVPVDDDPESAVSAGHAQGTVPEVSASTEADPQEVNAPAEETPVEETAAEPTYTVSETLTRPVPGEVMTEFSDTINDKLDDLSEITDPDSTLARVIDIMKDRADSFKGSGRADGTDMIVSYVMRTATDSSSNSTSTTEETTTETETKDSFWNRVANLFSK